MNENMEEKEIKIELVPLDIPSEEIHNHTVEKHQYKCRICGKEYKTGCNLRSGVTKLEHPLYFGTTL